MILFDSLFKGGGGRTPDALHGYCILRRRSHTYLLNRFKPPTARPQRLKPLWKSVENLDFATLPHPSPHLWNPVYFTDLHRWPCKKWNENLDTLILLVASVIQKEKEHKTALATYVGFFFQKITLFKMF